MTTVLGNVSPIAREYGEVARRVLEPARCTLLTFSPANRELSEARVARGHGAGRLEDSCRHHRLVGYGSAGDLVEFHVSLSANAPDVLRSRSSLLRSR